MYHIKNDKRARASTELICAGLLACMKEKPFARITITDAVSYTHLRAHET